MRGSGVTLTVPAEIIAIPRFHATIKLSGREKRRKAEAKNIKFFHFTEMN